MKKIFFSILFSCVSALAIAQIDTAFWFANPRLDPGHMKYAMEQRVSFVVVTYAESAEVTITRPAQGDTIFRTERVPAHSTRKIHLFTRDDYTTKIETPADGVAHNNGIFVHSSEKVTVYWVATQSNSEIYTLKGQFGLGTEFVVPQQYKYKCVKTADSSVPYASIEVVASEDDTYVTFKTLVATNLGPAGKYTSPRLNRGQTYAIRAAEGETSAANHLGGTVVTATKPVAVNTTDDSATSYDCGNDYGDKDLIGEQLVPTSLAGSRYIIAANNSKAVEGVPLHEIAYLYAIEEGTEVYAGTAAGEQLVATISPGHPYAMPLDRMTGTFLFTKTNQPFIVFQLTANDGGCELSGTVLPSLDCSGSTEVSYVPALDGKTVTVTLVTRTEYTGSFLVNNDPYTLSASDFHPVPGNEEWSYCSCKPLSLVGKEKNIRIVNTMGVFHFGVLDAGGGAASYGYFSNYGAIAVNFQSQQDYYYEGDDVQFHLESSGLLENIWWEGPNGRRFGDNEIDPTITNVTMSDAGRYVVHATHKEGCDILPDTIFLNVLKNVETTEIDSCLNETISIQSSGLYPYEWYKNETQLTVPDTTKTLAVTVGAEDYYTASSFLPGFDVAKLADSIDVTLHQTDTLIIWRKEIRHLIVGATYRWTVSATTLIQSTAANKLILHAGDTTTGIWSLTNIVGAENIYVLEFVPKHETGVFKVIVAKPKANRAIRLRSMSLVPIIQVVEDFHVTGRDCSDDPIPCPKLQVFNTDTTVCDTLLPMTWRGFYYTEPGMQHGDTIKSPRGCDSILYTYTLHTKSCEPIPPMPCPTVLINNTDTTVCDTLMPFTWRGFVFEEPGTKYGDTIRYVDNPDCDSLVYTYTLYTKTCERPDPPQPEDTCLHVLTQRWNDIIAVKNKDYNGGYDFVSFVWYLNGVLLADETKSYIYIPEQFGAGDVYSVTLRDVNGRVYRACDFTPEHLEYEGDGLGEVTKRIEDGQLVIIRNGKRYNAVGGLMK